MLLLVATPAHAHRLDEYLQATMISVSKDRVSAQIRLTPGVDVFSRVLAGIDTNADGAISDAEQRAYAERVLRDLSLAMDGTRVPLRLTTWKFASIAELKEGRGDIQIDFDAATPRGGPDRRLTFENHHQRAISEYLVNVLVPLDPDIRVTGQSRSYEQASYRLDFAQAGSALASGQSSQGVATRATRSPTGPEWLGYVGMLRLGMRHIAEGTDHLLFLLVLLLPAPLLAGAGRWGRHAGVRASAGRLLRIVTAFTVGHSLTLAAVATGLVSAPSGPVEVLIAVSILVSAVHALRPIFPGREAYVAGGFGLVHGLAFATLISSYGLDLWHRTLTVLGFNLGIELMQLAILAATVPSLLLLARTPVYGVLRVAGAAVAGVAALGWIGERAFGLANPVGSSIESAAGHGSLLVAILAAIALGATMWDRGARHGSLPRQQRVAR
jgi:hypothetical protein